MAGSASSSNDSGGEEAASESLLDTLQALLHELPGLISDRVELFALELARAGRALARIVAWLVAIAIVGVTAWLALWAGLVVGLIQLGLHWAWALLIVLAINLVAAVAGLKQVRRLAGRLSLPATRRHLTMAGSTRPPPEPPSRVPTADPPFAGPLRDGPPHQQPAQP
jgi:uncharacterized membrane protein YqjE